MQYVYWYLWGMLAAAIVCAFPISAHIVSAWRRGVSYAPDLRDDLLFSITCIVIWPLLLAFAAREVYHWWMYEADLVGMELQPPIHPSFDEEGPYDTAGPPPNPAQPVDPPKKRRRKKKKKKKRR